MVQAIVYTTNSGFTAEYAEMLGAETGLPVKTLKEAKKILAKGTSVVYLGWLMASGIKDYKKAAARFRVLAACGVGLAGKGENIEEIRKASKIPSGLPLFSLQGGFDIAKLHGIYKRLMSLVSKMMIKDILKKEEKTQDDLEMVQVLQQGGSFVSKENLVSVLEWMRQEK